MKTPVRRRRPPGAAGPAQPPIARGHGCLAVAVPDLPAACRGRPGRGLRGHDEELHREVALKEILERHVHDTENRLRFLLEAEVTGGLEHPGIVPVYGLGQYEDGRPYYAMRFIRGESLKSAIRHVSPGRQAGA